jgi:hypothetical protein
MSPIIGGRDQGEKKLNHHYRALGVYQLMGDYLGEFL